MYRIGYDVCTLLLGPLHGCFFAGAGRAGATRDARAQAAARGRDPQKGSGARLSARCSRQSPLRCARPTRVAGVQTARDPESQDSGDAALTDADWAGLGAALCLEAPECAGSYNQSLEVCSGSADPDSAVSNGLGASRRGKAHRLDWGGWGKTKARTGQRGRPRTLLSRELVSLSARGHVLGTGVCGSLRRLGGCPPAPQRALASLVLLVVRRQRDQRRCS